MAGNFNKVFLMGNLTRDVELKYTPSDQPVANIGLAVNRRYRTREGEDREESTFVDCEAWGRTAEVCNQYLKKGSKVLVEGRLNPDRETGGPRIWTRQDGTPAASFEITAATVRFLSSKGEDDGYSAPDNAGPPDQDEAIPF